MTRTSTDARFERRQEVVVPPALTEKIASRDARIERGGGIEDVGAADELRARAGVAYVAAELVDLALGFRRQRAPPRRASAPRDRHRGDGVRGAGRGSRRRPRWPTASGEGTRLDRLLRERAGCSNHHSGRAGPSPGSANGVMPWPATAARATWTVCARRLCAPSSSATTPSSSSFVGELDLYNADEVRAAFLGAAVESASRVVVDLAASSLADLPGARRARRGPRAPRRRATIAAPGPAVRRALEVAGLDRHFVVHESVDDALAG